jgi:hypothetical protein
MSRIFRLKYKKPSSGEFIVPIESYHANYINSFSRSFLFQLNAQNMWSTHMSPITSYMFRCLLHHLQADHCITSWRTKCFCSGAIKCTTYNVQCTMYNIPCFFKFTILLHFLKHYYFVLLYPKNLKNLVKIISCSILIFVRFCYLLCVLAVYVFTVSSCVWVRSGVEILRGPGFAININLLLCCSSILMFSCFIVVSLCYKIIL